MSRPIDFASLYPAKRNEDGRLDVKRIMTPSGYVQSSDPVVTMVGNGGAWQLKLGIELSIADYRHILPPGEWVVRLVIGSNDGRSGEYDVQVAWKGDEPDPEKALSYLLDHLEVMKV